MQQLQSPRKQPGATGRQAFRPSRQTLRIQCLHKALRKPKAGPITAPADVVYECLTLFRRPDLESLVPFFPVGAFDPTVRRVGLVVGGEEVEETGPLACCHSFMDTAARRVLPGHLLRRCRVLSSLQLPGGVCQLRVALTARTGEEAVFVWRLRCLAAHEGAGAGAGAAAAAAEASRTAPAATTALGPTTLRAAAPESGPEQPEAAGAGRRTSAEAPPGATHPAGGATDAAPSSSSSSSPTQQSEPQLRRLSVEVGSQPPPAPEGGPGAAAGGCGPGSPGLSRVTWAPRGSPPSLSPPALLPAAHPGEATTAAHGQEGEAAAAAAAAAAGGAGAGAAAVGERQGLVPEQGTTSRVVSEQPVTSWVVERVSRDDSRDEEEMPVPGPAGRGPHPRCSPEQVVKAQLAALRRGDVAGAASFNLWSRSTSRGWDLHMSAFRAMLRQPSYHVLLTCGGAELGPSALPSGHKMVQEVRLLAGGGAGADPGRGPGPGPR